MNKILFLILITPILVISQTTYFVDATNGNDVNDGLSVGNAWQSISKVNNQVFVSGDQILFKRNEIWKGERLYIENIYGTVTNKVTYAAYGNGQKPIITSMVTQTLNWTNVSGDIWMATNSPAEHPERMLVNNTEILRANIFDELSAVNNYNWFYNNDTSTLYLYSTVNPTSHTIAYSTDFPLIISEANHITINNIDFQGGWTSIYITTHSQNISLDNLNIGKYAREGIIISTESSSSTDIPKNILISNCMFDSYFALDYSSAADYPESSDRGSSDGIRTEQLINGEIQNCYFKNWGHASINIDGVNVSNILVYNNYLTSPDICYGGRIGVDDAIGVQVYNNQIINTSVQSQLNGQSNHYHHNIFFGTTDTPIVTDVVDAGIELQGYSYSEVKNNIYENNIILNTEGPGIRISGNNDFNVYNNIFRNNIIYNCGSQISGKSLVIEQDQFGTTYNNTFKNNLIYNLATTQSCEFKNNISNVTIFNTVTNNGYQIVNNISNNPLLIDVDGSDYHLTSNSPCVDSGVNILSTIDFEGNLIPFNMSNPDIGIYEYQNTIDIDNFYFNETIIMSPNPAQNATTIYSVNINSIKKITLIDVNGKIILKNILINTSFSTNLLSEGLYFIKVETAHRILIKKLIVIK